MAAWRSGLSATRGREGIGSNPIRLTDPCRGDPAPPDPPPTLCNERDGKRVRSGETIPSTQPRDKGVTTKGEHFCVDPAIRVRISHIALVIPAHRLHRQQRRFDPICVGRPKGEQIPIRSGVDDIVSLDTLRISARIQPFTSAMAHSLTRKSWASRQLSRMVQRILRIRYASLTSASMGKSSSLPHASSPPRTTVTSPVATAARNPHQTESTQTCAGQSASARVLIAWGCHPIHSLNPASSRRSAATRETTPTSHSNTT